MSDLNRLRKLSGKAALVGYGETPYVRSSAMSVEETYMRVALEAIADSGLTPRDIDGILMPSYTALPPGMLEDFLDITPDFVGLMNVGGASAVSLVLNAAVLVSSGVATNVLCITARNANAIRPPRSTSGVRAEPPPARGYYDPLRLSYGWGESTPPALFATMARRYMDRYGSLTGLHLAEVAVTTRNHAMLNEHAQMRTPITVEDHQSSRMVADPFRLLDCCVISDGGAGVVVTTTERARDLPKKPVVISGFAQGRPRRPGELVNRPVLDELGLERAAPVAYAMADVGPEDADFAQIYDCFTYVVIKQLEILGFCRPGEGGEFVGSGAIRLDGSIPVNTHGGLLSQGHMSGMNHIVEAVRQLRGEAGGAQLRDPHVGLVTGYGDMGDGSMLVLNA